MGLSPSILQELISLKRSGAMDNRTNVIEIGAQQLSNGFLRDKAGLELAYSLHGKSIPDLGAPIEEGIVDGVEGLSESNPSSREFWQSLGYTYSAIDFDGHRDSIALDLNRDATPRNMRGAFDFVVNTGTTEHVANQDNAFRVIHDLTRKGGIMFHDLPAGGMMNHGLMNYNPKFFWALCRENDYRVLSLRTQFLRDQPDTERHHRKQSAVWWNTDIESEGITDFLNGGGSREKA